MAICRLTYQDKLTASVTGMLIEFIKNKESFDLKEFIKFYYDLVYNKNNSVEKAVGVVQHIPFTISVITGRDTELLRSLKKKGLS